MGGVRCAMTERAALNEAADGAEDGKEVKREVPAEIADSAEF